VGIDFKENIYRSGHRSGGIERARQGAAIGVWSVGAWAQRQLSHAKLGQLGMANAQRHDNKTDQKKVLAFQNSSGAGVEGERETPYYKPVWARVKDENFCT